MRPGEVSQAEFRDRTDPQTGRRIRQLTAGPWDDYPLYYFIPTTTADGRYLIFHRLHDGEVQYHRLDLTSGETVCLTGAQSPGALREAVGQEPFRGVREIVGALNQVTGELLYVDGPELRAVHVITLADRLVLRMAPDRVICSQNSVSPDGRWFVYAHVDRAWWEAQYGKPRARHTARGCRLEVLDLTTGASRALLAMNGWITHVTFYDNDRIVLSHPPTEQGILLTDRTGEWLLALRPQSPDGSQTCHYHATARGVVYELNTYAEPVDRSHGRMGVFDLDTRTRREYRVGARITHIGFDPEGRLWFGEQIRETPRFGRLIGYCPRLFPDREAPFVPLTEPIVTFGDQHQQRAHTHPALMPDRRHILFTAGDPDTQTNHPCLLDIADLHDTVIEA